MVSDTVQHEYSFHWLLDPRPVSRDVLIARPAGIWRDRVVFTWDYRTFNFRDNILKAASALLPRTPVSGVTLIDPPPNIERPYNDLSFIQCHIKFDTDKVGASALCNIIHTPVGYRIWTLNTVIESLHGFPEIPERDGHMTGPQSWPARRAMDNEMVEHEPEVLIIVREEPASRLVR
jgi:hypothetical protein